MVRFHLGQQINLIHYIMKTLRDISYLSKITFTNNIAANLFIVFAFAFIVISFLAVVLHFVFMDKGQISIY